MKRFIKCLTVCIVTAAIIVTATACTNSSSNTALDPKNPATVTVWNYYNGAQLTAFEELVDEFNATVGTEKGIVVASVSQGDIGTLADSLIDAVNGKAGAADIPSLAAVYSETAFILDKADALAPFDSYFTDEELSAYIPGFIEEGRFNENNDLLLFPTSKSTEVFAVNSTDWAEFAAETGITLDSVKTAEDLVAAAKIYYEWSDALTPDILNDGRALYGRDSLSNYIYIGANQLGHEIFNVQNGKVTLDIDRDTFKTLWENFYIPFISGYFGAYANFRSEDAKTGKILALTSSTSSVTYLPLEVTTDDDTTYAIDMTIRKSLPFANAVNEITVQQGASYCLLKSTEAEQEGAVEFLKWFTDPSRNLKFSICSGYSPVTAAANTEQAITEAFADDISDEKQKIILDTLIVSADIYTNTTSYSSKPFDGSKDARSLIDTSMEDIAAADRVAVIEKLKSGSTLEQAIAPYSTDEYFDQWFNDFKAQLEEIVAQ